MWQGSPVPVVVTGADTPIGALLLDRLVGQGLDLRATVDDRDAVRPLVDRGIRTAVSDLGDAERFGAIVDDAHTIVHLRGGSATAMLDGIPDVLDALPESEVRRIVTLAGLGASHPSLAQLDALEVSTIVLRVGVVLAPLDDPRAEPPDVRPKSRRVAPLHVDDLVSALVAADRLRDLSGHLSVDAVGRDVVTAGELDDLLGTRRRFRLGRGGGGDDLVGDRGESLARVLGVEPMPLERAVRLVAPRST